MKLHASVFEISIEYFMIEFSNWFSIVHIKTITGPIFPKNNKSDVQTVQ
jgi:hypothetical protein